MSSETRVSRRYAAALFGIAQRDGITDAVLKDLTVVERFVREVPYLRAVLMQPLVSRERKDRVLSEAFGERVTAETLNFLYLLVRKRRETLLDECIADFRRMADEQAGRLVATVTSAVPLSTVQVQALIAALKTRTGKDVEVIARIDPDVLGGIQVRLGDQIIDGTVRTRLERIRQQLLGVR